jgi:acyl dehydratase
MTTQIAPRPGDTFSAVVVDGLTRTQIVQYAGASGDFNPVHTDEMFAREVAGYPTVFAHGMLTMAMTGRVLIDLFGLESLVDFGGRFTSQVWPGDVLSAHIRVDDVEPTPDGMSIVSLSFETRRQGDTVVFRGSARARMAGPTPTHH